MLKKICLIIYLLSSVTVYGQAKEKINVVATTTDLADIVKEIGKEKVEVISLSHGDQSGCNSVEPRPSLVMGLRKADLFVRIGMAYDSWSDSLLDAARNSKIVFGAPGYVDTSVGIERLEVPKGKVDASLGHVHIYGNPHYWLDPQNGEVMVKNIVDGLGKVSGSDAEYFKKNGDEYSQKLKQKISEWAAKLEPYKGNKVVSYHKSWEYFARRFGFEIIATIEPKPGIPPSPAYLNRLIEQLKPQKNIIILHENIYPVKTSRMVAKETGAKVIVLPIATGGMKGAIKSYIGLFDYIVAKIAEN
ncbi:MAG: metal ABC transporter substrate-binding protein [Elusimicrobiota bacterium]